MPTVPIGAYKVKRKVPVNKKPLSPFGIRLLEAIHRKYSEPKQQRLVEAIHVRKTLVSAWMYGTLPNTQHLMDISRELDVSIDFLLFGKDGDADLDQTPINRLEPTLRRTITVMQRASPEARAVLERVARLLATNQTKVIEAIDNGVIVAQARKRIAVDIRKRVPENVSEEPGD